MITRDGDMGVEIRAMGHDCPYETFARRGGAALSAAVMDELTALHVSLAVDECVPATTTENGRPEPTRQWSDWVRDHK